MLTDNQLQEIADSVKSRLFKTLEHPENELIQRYVKIAVDASVMALNEYEKATHKLNSSG